MMVSHWGVSENKSPQISRTLLSVLTSLNRAVVWMVTTRHLIFKSSCPCINFLDTLPITIGITITFRFHGFYNSPSKDLGTYLSFCFLSILLWGQPGQQSRQFDKYFFFFSFFFFFFLLFFFFFFLLTFFFLGLVVWPRLVDQLIFQNPRKICASHFLVRILGCAYTICSYDKISISCTIPVGSPCSPSHA